MTHLVPCPICGASEGYTLGPGESYRWRSVKCGSEVAECRMDTETAFNPEAWPRADKAWNEAGAHAESLRQVNAELVADNAKLRTVMVAAAEEIAEHWDAHCDAEGYGPANLLRRLEEGIPSQYGYTAGAFARLKEDYQRACGLVADMHAAALGEMTGPRLGVVEDVADLRRQLNEKSDAIQRLWAERDQLRAQVAQLAAALREISDDYADRFDLESQSTNPGIKSTIKLARETLAEVGDLK